MKAAPFDYHRPATVAEAVQTLAEFGDEAKVLAGGQSLIPLLAMRLTHFENLVDISRVPELQGIDLVGDEVVIAAGTSHALVGMDDEVADSVPLLSLAAPHIGHFQIRNRGTLGGAIAHADPAAEFAAVALTLDATIVATSTRGDREIAAADFFTGLWENALAADELLRAARFPVWSGRVGFGVHEFARRHGDFAIAGPPSRSSWTPRTGCCAAASACSDWVPPRNGAPPPNRPSPGARSPTSPPRSSAGWHCPTCRTCPPICRAHRPTAAASARRWSPGPGPTQSRRRSMPELPVQLSVNGREYTDTVEPRVTLADHLRENCGLTGTHLGCEHGACGACTVLLDGQAVRSCLVLAVQADGQEVTTVEGIASPDGELSPVQAAMRECHGLQCGFCTPGFVTSITALLRDNPDPTDEEIREGLSGNFCRCTGYQGIVNAVKRAAEQMN